ncbi:General transcription factor 3C polypeptide 3, partial [Brachionus plicatilis]
FDVPDTCNKYVKSQFIVCLINLNYDNEECLIDELLSNDIKEIPDEVNLVANTYYGKQNWLKAKKLYLLLLTNVADYLVYLDVWLKYGNCCSYLDEVEEAINAYRNAVNLDSTNCEAALSLVNILKKNSLLFEEATNVIRNTLSSRKAQPLNTDIISLMIHECLIEFEQQNYEKFIQNSRLLLFGDFLYVLESKNINQLQRADSRAQRAVVFHQILEENDFEGQEIGIESLEDDDEEDDIVETTSKRAIMEKKNEIKSSNIQLSCEKFSFNYNKLHQNLQNMIFDIFLKLCKTLVHLKRHSELLMYSFGATVLPMVYERIDWNKAIQFSCLVACILKKDGYNAFNILKDFILEFKNSNKLWSFVGIVIGLCPSLSQQKFFIRLSAKYMDHLPLCMINAHFAIMSGTYRYALVEYMNCFKQNPFDPFINLIISITYCHISCQKYNTKRHLLVSQSLVFLRRYIKFRGVCQETYFNIGRIMHQLSLFDLAAHYYKKCLETECTFPKQKEVYDLTRFAAYNLILIYKQTGSHELARNVMREYLTI